MDRGSDDHLSTRRPAALQGIVRDTAAVRFTMASEPILGELLAVLAASKPGGRFLELGRGTGHGTAWMLRGMAAASRLDTVDTDADVVAVAKRHLDRDPRATFHLINGAEFIQQAPPRAFNVIYGDAWPGKFTHLDEVLGLLRVGGVYVIDDLLPQATWPDGHAANIPPLIDALERRADFAIVRQKNSA